MNDVLLRNAYSLHQAGRLAEAARAYGEILNENPRQFDALYLLGLIHLQSGRFEDAERILSQAIALQPPSTDALFARATALQQMGRHAEAVAVLDKLLALKSDNAIAWNNRGNSLLALDHRNEAIASYDRALALKSDYAEAWHNRAVALMTDGKYSEAEANLNKALSLKPNYADALEHRGIALAALGRHEEALKSYDAVLTHNPANAQIHQRRGDCLLNAGRLTEALSAYDRSLSLLTNNAEAWHNRGVALSRLGRLLEAVQSYERALALRRDFAEASINRGSALFELKNHAEALASYNKVLAARPANAEALKSRGTVLMVLQHYAQALADFDAALTIRRDDAAVWQGRGNALSRLGHNEEALQSYDEALRLKALDADTLYNRANVLALLKRFEEAARDGESLLEIAPDYGFGPGLLMHARLHACDWRGLDDARERIASAVRSGRRVIQPFLHLAVSASPDEHLQSAKAAARELYPPVPQPLWRGERYAHEKIRIAYLSADFHSHATAFLMAGVFEHHDRTRFQTTAISFGPNDESPMRKRLERAFDRFMDVTGEPDATVAAMLRRMEIDIAIDLKGYTVSARPGILAFRPAPLQIHYLGYPGSMGADYVDYLIADRVLISENARDSYAEQIVYLPDTYQCNDTARRKAEHVPTRAEAGLPQTGFVFCCFNSNYKIMPEMFDIWMRLLSKVEGSVFWFFGEHPSVVASLRREAVARGISAERLLFAGHAELEAHLARLTLADLVLDTLPYGAHTTASDALWVGVPILTCLGKTFAGRVAASLLTAVGLPELIAPSLEEYERRALQLAQDALGLAKIKAKLAMNRDRTALFDTARFTRHLEAAYIQMWERHQRGEAPASFAIKANVPVSS